MYGNSRLCRISIICIVLLCTLAHLLGMHWCFHHHSLLFRRFWNVKRLEWSWIVMDIITQSITSCKMCHPPGLFVRREWQDLNRDMDQIELGNASLFHDSDLDSHKLAHFEYGCSRNVGLFLCLPSSSSPIAISALGLPIPPLLVVMFFSTTTWV